MPASPAQPPGPDVDSLVVLLCRDPGGTEAGWGCPQSWGTHCAGRGAPPDPNCVLFTSMSMWPPAEESLVCGEGQRRPRWVQAEGMGSLPWSGRLPAPEAPVWFGEVAQPGLCVEGVPARPAPCCSPRRGPGWVQGPSRAEAAAGRLTPQACLSWRGLSAPHGRLSQGGRGPGGRLQLSLPCAALPGLMGHRQPPPVRPWPPRWPWAHRLSTGAGPSASGPWSGQVGAHGLCVALTGPGPYLTPSQGSVPWWQAAALALGLSLSPVPVAC